MHMHIIAKSSCYAFQVQRFSHKFSNRPSMCMRAALLQSNRAELWLVNTGTVQVLQQALHILESLLQFTTLVVPVSHSLVQRRGAAGQMHGLSPSLQICRL